MVNSLLAVFNFRYFSIEVEKLDISFDISDIAAVKHINIPAIPNTIILEYDSL